MKKRKYCKFKSDYTFKPISEERDAHYSQFNDMLDIKLREGEILSICLGIKNDYIISYDPELVLDELGPL